MFSIHNIALSIKKIMWETCTDQAPFKTENSPVEL